MLKLSKFMNNLMYIEATSPNWLNLECLVSQGCDGASVISAQCSAVQQRVREKVPHAIYVHCNAHILKLLLVDPVKAVPQAADLFALLEVFVCYFMSSLKAHTILINKQ